MADNAVVLQLWMDCGYVMVLPEGCDGQPVVTVSFSLNGHSKILPYLKKMSVKMDLVEFKNRCNGILMRLHKNPLDQ